MGCIFSDSNSFDEKELDKNRIVKESMIETRPTRGAGSHFSGACNDDYQELLCRYQEQEEELKKLKRSRSGWNITWNNNWDGRDDLRKLNKGTRHILLIRHGQYHQDALTEEGKTLTDLGKDQAKWAGQRLKEYDLDYDKIIISTMPRAKETGDIIASFLDGVEIEYCDLLREGFPAPPRPPLFGWEIGSNSKNIDDMERIKKAFDKYIHRPDEGTLNKTTVIVSHDNVIRSMVCRSLQVPPNLWFRFGGQNCSMTCISCATNGRVWLRMFGDVGFMPADKVTYGFKNFCSIESRRKRTEQKCRRMNSK